MNLRHSSFQPQFGRAPEHSQQTRAPEMLDRPARPSTKWGNSGFSGAREHVLIIGATGFLGGWITRHLVDGGAKVACLVRSFAPVIAAIVGTFASSPSSRRTRRCRSAAFQATKSRRH